MVSENEADVRSEDSGGDWDGYLDDDIEPDPNATETEDPANDGQPSGG